MTMPEMNNKPLEPAARARRSLYISLGMWGTVVGSIWASGYFVRTGLFFRGVHPVPLRVNPLLLVLSLILLPSIAALFAHFTVRAGRLRVIPAIVGLGLVLVGCGALFGAMYPGSMTVVARDELRVPDRPASERVFAIPVFFSNGRDQIEHDEGRRLKDEFEVYSSCGKADVFVRGFASSRPYRDRNASKNGPARTKEWLNNDLANRRALAVESFMKKELKIDTELADPWPAYEDMVAQRRLKDTDLEGKLIPKVERLNRRVEIYWKTNLCFGPEEATASSAKQ
jgi:outer membrane protein OmpA-like peptidoglycan-associated protein